MGKQKKKRQRRSGPSSGHSGGPSGLRATGGNEREYLRLIGASGEAGRRAGERERLLEDIFLSIQDGISVLDADLSIVRVNAAVDMTRTVAFRGQVPRENAPPPQPAAGASSR